MAGGSSECSSSMAFFTKHFSDTSSDEKSGDDTNILMDLSILIHKKNENEDPKFKGLVKGRLAALNCNIESCAMFNCTLTTFVLPRNYTL
jgi:hypothetical protein